MPQPPLPGAILRSFLSANATLLLAGLMSFVLMGAGQSIYGPALPVFADRFGIGLAQVGWVISAQWIGAAVGVVAMLLAGRHIGPRHALALMTAGGAVMATGLGWWMTLAGSVIFGSGYGVCAAVFNPRVLKAFEARGAAMVSLLNAMFAAGAIFAPLAFVATGSNPQLAFGAIAALCVLVFLLAGPDRDRAASAAAPSAPYRFRPLILTFAVFGIAIEASLIGLGPTALIRAGHGGDQAAQLLSLFFVTFLLARVVLVFVAHRLRPFDIYLAAMALSALCALASTVLPPALFFVAMGASAGWFFPGAYVTATRQMGDHPNVAPTILGAGLVGGISSPVIVAALTDGMGDRGFFWLIGGLALVVTVAAIGLRRRFD